MHTLLSRAFIAVAVLVALTASVLVTAQTQGSKEISELSIPEMVEQAGEYIDGMEEALKNAFKSLEASIGDNDVSAVTAQNEAITTMKGLMKLSDENYLTLQQKAAEGDREKVEHEYVKISIAAAKIRELTAQVESAGSGGVDFENAAVQQNIEITPGAVSLLSPGSTNALTASFNQPAQVPAPPIYTSPYF